MLVVCGESFSYGGDITTWPVMVADKLEMPLVNLSLVGCGNNAICHQIQYVLDNLEPTYVIISLTAAERFEIDEDEFGAPATIEDFKYNIDEVKDKPFKRNPTITSGNVASQLRNASMNYIKSYLISSSQRLSAQNQAWAINSGPYDYESELVNSTNHLSFEDNIRFSERVLNDLNGTQQKQS